MLGRRKEKVRRRLAGNRWKGETGKLETHERWKRAEGEEMLRRGKAGKEKEKG